MKKLAILTAIAAITGAFLWNSASLTAQEEELPDVFMISPSVCLALSPLSNATACLPAGHTTSASGGTLYDQTDRDGFLGTALDEDADGEITKEEVNRFVAFSGTQLHETDGSMAIIAFVEDDNRIAFDSDSGAFLVAQNTLVNDFVCDQPPGADSLASDEDCDGDGEEGDGIVIAQFFANGDDRGPGVVEVFDATNGEVIGDIFYEIVGEPDAMTAGPFETVLSAGLRPEDCTLPGAASGFLDALGRAEKTIIFGAVTDDDDVPVTNAWITWTSSDEDVLQVASGTSPTLDLGTFGIAAPNILCGIGAGTATLTLDLDPGAKLGDDILTLDAFADSETVELEITVLPAADSAALSVAPASVDCNGTNTAEVSATVVTEDGDPVVDGSTVFFDVVALGVASPGEAITTGGVAKTTVTPLSSELAGVTVIVTVPIGPADFATDLNDDGLDNDDINGADDGGEFNLDDRVPNTDVIVQSIIVACNAGGATAPPADGGTAPPAGGGGGAITGPDTGSGGQAAGTGSLPVWSAIALFTGAMALVGARLAVRRID